MPLVVLLRGLNVGGHRRFRPAALAQQLQHLDAVNIGAAGTLVIRKPVGRRQLHAEVERRLPFAADIVICEGAEIVGLLSQRFFTRTPTKADVVRFVSVLSRAPRAATRLPVRFPSRGRWLVKVLACEGRFVVGMYRRDMKVIGYLGALDQLFGVPLTTRNWRTMTAIAKALPYVVSAFRRTLRIAADHSLRNPSSAGRTNAPPASVSTRGVGTPSPTPTCGLRRVCRAISTACSNGFLREWFAASGGPPKGVIAAPILTDARRSTSNLARRYARL